MAAASEVLGARCWVRCLDEAQLRIEWKPLASLDTDTSRPLAEPGPSLLDPAQKGMATVLPDLPGRGLGLGTEDSAWSGAGSTPG